MIIATQKSEIAGINVYIKPTYTVIMPARSFERGPMSELQRLNMKHLKHNKPTGKISKKAQRRLTNSVNWLVAAAKKKYVYDKRTNKRFSFKVNFVTLTLPGDHQLISDHQFKSKLLHNFINVCRYRYGLKNFVWKVEAQDNGKIHAHFTTDTYLPWRGIRSAWNKILDKHGLLDQYRAKHQNMTFEEYNEIYNPKNEIEIQKMKARFSAGNDSNWSDPNSTDVHSVYKVKDIAAYLGKYMSKKEEDRRCVKGRLWSCSYSIAQANKLSMRLPFDSCISALNTYLKSDLDGYELKPNNKPEFENSKVGDIYFHKLSDWFGKISGPIAELYKKTLFNIRNNIDLSAFEEVVNTVVDNVVEKPPALEPQPRSWSDQTRLFNNFGR